MEYTEDAKIYYLKALEIDPQYINAYFNLGHMLLSEGYLEDSLLCFQKCLEINPKDEESRKLLYMLKNSVKQ